MKMKCRKGATIAEMCIVMAVALIISLMVISFSKTVSWRTKINSARLDLANDLQTIEAVVDGWAGQMKLQKFDLSASETEVNAGGYTLSFETKEKEDKQTGILNASLPGDVSLTYEFDYVESVKFSTMERTAGSADKLLFCTVEYIMPGVPEEQATKTQTFCVYPHLGSTYEILAAEGGTQ